MLHNRYIRFRRGRSNGSQRTATKTVAGRAARICKWVSVFVTELRNGVYVDRSRKQFHGLAEISWEQEMYRRGTRTIEGVAGVGPHAKDNFESLFDLMAGHSLLSAELSPRYKLSTILR